MKYKITYYNASLGMNLSYETDSLYESYDNQILFIPFNKAFSKRVYINDIVSIIVLKP